MELPNFPAAKKKAQRTVKKKSRVWKKNDDKIKNSKGKKLNMMNTNRDDLHLDVVDCDAALTEILRENLDTELYVSMIETGLKSKECYIDFQKITNAHIEKDFNLSGDAFYTFVKAHALFEQIFDETGAVKSYSFTKDNMVLEVKTEHFDVKLAVRKADSCYATTLDLENLG